MNIIAGKLFGAMSKAEQGSRKADRPFDAEKFSSQYASYFAAAGGLARANCI